MGFTATNARTRRQIIADLDLLPAENYRKTRAQGVADFNIGDAFCSDEIGELRRYERVAAAPGYSDLSDTAAPANRKMLDENRAEATRATNGLATLTSNALAERQRGFNTKLAATTGALAVGDTFVTSGARQPGDGGSAQYRVVAVEPAHPGKLALNNGLWAEIFGPYLPVEAFGAVGDCPDVSGMPPTNQAAINAAIGGATNDAAAFQRAFWASVALGGAIVTYGHGKVYRIAFSTAGIWALVIGNNTALQQVGGGFLEFDPSLLTGVRPGPSIPGRGYCEAGITAGDPITMTNPVLSGVSASAIVDRANSQNILNDLFVRNIKFDGVTIRQHTRTYWHALPDIGNGVRRLRLFGLNMSFVDGLQLNNVDVRGTTNTGILTAFARNVTAIAPDVRLCGYGAVLGTSQNNYTFAGGLFVGRPEYDGDNFKISNASSYYAKDEGIAYGLLRGFITDFLSVGDHDAAIEGDISFKTTATGASLGHEIPCDITITGVIQNGRHTVSRGTIAAGSTALQLEDAFYVASDGANGRFIFITGAGADGGDGPFAIAGVNYTTNVVTLGSPAANAVNNAVCYTHSRTCVNSTDGNEGRFNLTRVRGRNIKGSVHPIVRENTDGGIVTISDIELENVSIPTNFRGVRGTGDYVTIRNIKGIKVSGDSSTAMIGGTARKKLVIDGVDLSESAIGAVYVGPGAAGADISIRGLQTGSCPLTPIRLAGAFKAGKIEITGNECIGANSLGNMNYGFVTIETPALGAARLVIRNNRARVAGATDRPVTVVKSLATGSISGDVLTLTVAPSGLWSVGMVISGTGVTAGTYITEILSGAGGVGTYRVSSAQTAGPTAISGTLKTGAFDAMIVEDNDFGDPALQFTSIRTFFSESFDNSWDYATTFTDRRNQFYGQQTISFRGFVASGYIVGTTLTITALSGGRIRPGMILTSTGVAAGTTIVSGPAQGFSGEYQVSIAQTLGSSASPVTLYSDTPYQGTFAPGDRVINALPQSGGAAESVCTTGGTLATITGVTGSIPAGSNLLTVSSTNGITVQSMINVAGVSNGIRVLAINGSVLTLSSFNSGSAAVGAAVTLRQPAFRRILLP